MLTNFLIVYDRKRCLVPITTSWLEVQSKNILLHYIIFWICIELVQLHMKEYMLKTRNNDR